MEANKTEEEVIRVARQAAREFSKEIESPDMENIFIRVLVDEVIVCRKERITELEKKIVDGDGDIRTREMQIEALQDSIMQLKAKIFQIP